MQSSQAKINSTYSCTINHSPKWAEACWDTLEYIIISNTFSPKNKIPFCPRCWWLMVAWTAFNLFFLICKENNKIHINSPERSLPTTNFRSLVSFVRPCVLDKIGEKKRQRRKAKGRMELRERRRTLPKNPNAKGSEAVPDYVYLQAMKAMSSLFLLGAVPGLASCQPSREPNDSFDPIRISAKSTLCSLRAGTCQLTTQPPWIRPYVPNIFAQWAPRSPAITKHNHMWENTLLSQAWLKTLCMRLVRVIHSKCAVMFKVTALLLMHHDQQRLPLPHWKRKRKWCKNSCNLVSCYIRSNLSSGTDYISITCLQEIHLFCKKRWNSFF